MKKLRMPMFLLFSTVIPIIYLVVRFRLYEPRTVNIVSVWAVIAIAILLVIISVFIKFYLDGMKLKYSFLKQLLTGVLKIVLPLVFLIVTFVMMKTHIDWLSDNINLIIEALCVILACECVAIVVNPLPKWAFENKVDGIVEIVDKIKGENK